MKKKIAILGASYLQVPLVEKARAMGIETHVFAWEDGAVAKPMADHFYPVSIVDRNTILEICRNIQPDGITSIASDVAMPTVNYVATMLGLTGNTLRSTIYTTNKASMRRQLAALGLPCPRFATIRQSMDWAGEACNALTYPVIVKPVDRSGSRGVVKVDHPSDLPDAVSRAMDESFSKSVIVEEFIVGAEYSVEMLSWQGTHHFLAITEKVTTGSPYFVEIEQHQPASITSARKQEIIALVTNALTALQVTNGASHSELLIDQHGNLCIVEIGARMGGDNIGACLVPLSTGYDFLKGVIEVALGIEPCIKSTISKYAGIYYLTPPAGTVSQITLNTAPFPEIIQQEVFVQPGDLVHFPVQDSAQRSGYFIYQSEKPFKMANKNSYQIIETY